MEDKKEILEKAIQKAIDGGWYPYDHEDYLPTVEHILDWFELDEDPDYYKLFIFNHDFAKALWGKRVQKRRACPTCNFPRYGHDEGADMKKAVYCPYDGGKLKEIEEMIGAQPWANHLQQMVIAGDPIKYLGEYLNG